MSSAAHISSLASSFPVYRIKQLIHARLRGAAFVGIQSGFGIVEDLVLFNAPGKGRVTTLAIPRRAFDLSPEAAIAICEHKIFIAHTKAWLGELGFLRALRDHQ